MEKLYRTWKWIDLRDYQAHATWFDRVKYITIKYTRRLGMITAFVAFIAGTAFIYREVNPKTVQGAETLVVKTVIKDSEYPPILKKICDAESSGKQFNADGSVLRGVIDKSDIGICQINERYNNDEARRLGYDIYTEQGNKAFALHLFNTRGTQPWEASRCIKNGWGRGITKCD